MIRSLLKFELALLLVALMLAACDHGDHAGTVTDTGNTLALSGTVFGSDGKPAGHALVRIAAVSSQEDEVGLPRYHELTTDDSGRFNMEWITQDSFQLAAVDSARGEVALYPMLKMDASRMDSLSLEKAAVLKGWVKFDLPSETKDVVGSHFAVFVPGTPFVKNVFAGDEFSMVVPPGEWTLVVAPGDEQVVSKLQESGYKREQIFRTLKLKEGVQAGDTMQLGLLVWNIADKSDDQPVPEIQKNRGQVAGTVFCESKEACADVEVSLVTDIMGFGFTEGDSQKFVAQTKTDKSGRWILPAPQEVPFDSFRVEYRLLSSQGKVSGAGLSRYVYAREVADLEEDTLDVGSVTLTQPSGLTAVITLTVDAMDESQVDNCMLNSVVVGLHGTTHFVRGTTCNRLVINDLPAGTQWLLLYSGDPTVIKTLREAQVSVVDFVRLSIVELPEGGALKEQGLDYTPPTIKK